MGKELGTGYQLHLYGTGESSKRLCWRRRGRARWRPEPFSLAALTSARLLRPCWAYHLLSQVRTCFAPALVEITLPPRVWGYVLGPRRGYNRIPPTCSLVPTQPHSREDERLVGAQSIRNLDRLLLFCPYLGRRISPL